MLRTMTRRMRAWWLVTVAAGVMPLAVSGTCDVSPGFVDFVVFGDGHHHDDGLFFDVFVDDCCFGDELVIVEDDFLFWPF